MLINANQNLDETCQVARTGAAGICRYLDDCPVVLNELIELSLYPLECGWHNRKQIICCPVPPTRKPATELIQSNRTSAKSKCQCVAIEVNKKINQSFDEFSVFQFWK